MRRSLFVDHVVAHQLTPPGQSLLQSRLEVNRVLQRIFDLRGEGLHHGLGRALVADRQKAGPDDGLDH